MINIQWDSKFTVGNQKIDDEHKVFIDLIRSCSDQIDSGGKPEYIDRLLEELTLYARFHFFSEENLMIWHDYPDYALHKAEHIRLLTTLAERIYDYRSDPSTGEGLIEFIFEWFALHTTTVDKKLADHLAQQREAASDGLQP